MCHIRLPKGAVNISLTGLPAYGLSTVSDFPHLVPSALATGLHGETFFGLQVPNIQHTVRCLPDWPGQARPNQRRALAIRTFLLHTTR